MINHKLFVLAIFGVLANSALAAPVYTWQDEKGVTHYSSAPHDASAKPAELPEIMRGESKVAKGTLESCSSHGGVNCQSGPDHDGSVICYDGYKAASARFKFSCASPNLKITEVGERDRNGVFSVFVRNPSSVKAGGVGVVYKPANQTGPQKLEGPAEIEPFGLAEFKFNAARPELGLERVTIAQLDLSCSNCN